MPRAKAPMALIAQALALTVALFVSLIAVVSSAQAAENYGYQSISYSGLANPPTADKPQSKLWWNDGSWWADMWTTGTGWQIYRLDRATKAWVSTGVTNDTRSTASADTLWDGNKLYIASHVVTVSSSSPKPSLSGQPAKLYRYSYAAGKYTLDTGFPANINNNSSESLTIDKDTTGAVWATWTQVSGSSTSGYTSSVYVNSSAPGGTSWGTPFVLPVADPNPAPDDISAVVAYGSKKIGVMWSDQSAGTVYWATRTDGTSPTAASSWKVQPAVQGKGQADDHLNLKALLADSAGRVYAAVKTSLDETSSDKTLPQLQLLVFKPGTGAFTKSPIATIADCVSRPQILLDTANNQVRAFYTAPSTSVSGCAYSGMPGSIYEKTASMDNPVFGSGRGTPVIQDGASAGMNNVTTTKQSVNATTGVVVMASNKSTSRYWYSDRPLGTAPPPPPPGDTAAPTVTATSPAAGATGVAVGTDVTGSFSEAMNASTITPATFTLTTGTTTVPAAVTYNGTDKVATLNPGTDLAAGTTYTATIKGGAGGVKDAAGNALASDKTWTFTTASAGTGTSQTVTLTATADSFVSGGSTTTGTNYGTRTVLGVDANTVEISYLKFDLSAYAGRTVESATLQLRSAGSGSTGKQNVKLVADDSWTEGGITYTNRPVLGAIIGTLGPTTTNTNYNVPLTTSALAGELGQQLSLGMDSSSTDGVDLNSKEAGSTVAPKLVLTISSGGGGGTAPPPPPPGDTAAPTVTATSPAAGATGVAVGTDVTGSFSEAMNASTITPATFTLTTGTTTVPAAVTYNGTDKVATLNPGTDLAAGTTYTATIKGGAGGVKDAAGNALASDKTWTFTTASAGTGTSQTVTLTATADSFVSGGSTTTGTNYGTRTVLGVDANTVEISYLKFDLSAYAGRTVESATLQLRSAGSGSTGKQNVKLVADDSWTEGGITYTNRPVLGAIIGTLGPTTTNTNYNVPLTTSALAGELGQQLSLGMDSSSTDGVDLNSKEAGSTVAPKLVLTIK
ncbi:Ig-like domain-containing protein [Arthrobacter sp. D5-1]|uniref:CBM96 family carbohydrate-binding protein n=1 Tax=Arthrobacter sp. D5-1 TaxID=1477518 RepID=UPI001F614581|nr:Ig-like domain-containing protein [Arthrobacter sp. D5-1]